MCSESFQLIAAHLPQSGDQQVEAQELSAVLNDVSSNPAAIGFGRGVSSTARHRYVTLPLNMLICNPRVTIVTV